MGNIMGGTDHLNNEDLMSAHLNFNNDFSNSPALFNIQDIKFPLSTSGIKIVDQTGRRVKLAGANWSGGHMCRHCVDGLECRPLRDIAMHIRYKFKMNCIRLTYSLQQFYDNNIVPQKYLKANPELIGKTAMEIFDITIKVLTEVGLMVILNNHTSTSQWCCSNDDGDGLWWSHQYPEYQFFECNVAMAERYKNNERVIGNDLRNQLRKANGRDPTWGDGNPLTDWKRAATICGEKVLAVAPHWLIFVSGLNYQLDLTECHKAPMKFSVPNKLIYTGHFYGFSWPIPSWNLVSYDQFKKKLFNSQTFVRGLGVPYFLGEFGNNQRDIPWRYLLQYLSETDIDWTYWCLDGFKCDYDDPSKDQTYGVFNHEFTDARHPELLEDMINAGPPKNTIIQGRKQTSKIAQQVEPSLINKQNQPTYKQYQPGNQPVNQPINSFISQPHHVSQQALTMVNKTFLYANEPTNSFVSQTYQQPQQIYQQLQPMENKNQQYVQVNKANQFANQANQVNQVNQYQTNQFANNPNQPARMVGQPISGNNSMKELYQPYQQSSTSNNSNLRTQLPISQQFQQPYQQGTQQLYQQPFQQGTQQPYQQGTQQLYQPPQKTLNQPILNHPISNKSPIIQPQNYPQGKEKEKISEGEKITVAVVDAKFLLSQKTNQQIEEKPVINVPNEQTYKRRQGEYQ